MPRSLREENEKPVSITVEKAYFPMDCAGNGQRKFLRSQSPSCSVLIHADQPFYVLRWKTEPHLTPHCKACREHFFGQQSLNLP